MLACKIRGTLMTTYSTFSLEVNHPATLLQSQTQKSTLHSTPTPTLVNPTSSPLSRRAQNYPFHNIFISSLQFGQSDPPRFIKHRKPTSNATTHNILVPLPLRPACAAHGRRARMLKRQQSGRLLVVWGNRQLNTMTAEEGLWGLVLLAANQEPRRTLRKGSRCSRGI